MAPGETSILFGTAIPVLVLREKVIRTRVVAVLVIATGAVVLKLAWRVRRPAYR